MPRTVPKKIHGDAADVLHNPSELLRELEDSLQHYMDLFDKAPVGLAELDAQGTLRAMNLQAAVLLGKKREDLISRPMLPLIQKPFQREWLRTLRLLQMGQGAAAIDVQLEEIYEARKLRVELFRTETGPSQKTRAISLRCILREAAETAPVEPPAAKPAGFTTGQPLEKIVESIPLIVLTWDASLSRFTLNRLAKEVLGWTDEDAAREDFLARLYPDAAYRTEVIEHMHSLAPDWKEWTSITKDGSPVQIRWAIVAPNDQLRVGVGVDLRANRKYEESLQLANDELRRSNDELQRFASVAGHDLQEPLRMVKSFLVLLKQRCGDSLDAKATEFLGLAVEGAEHMSELLTALLAYSRLGSLGKALEPVQARLALVGALASLRTGIEEAAATVTHGPLPTVLADASQLTQLFQNLLGNALKFRRPDQPCQVHVSAAKKDSWWQFEVHDNGIGIDPIQFDRIFVIFQRLNPRDKYAGTGIGLAICKKIVERLGGKIWLESQPGKGTTFFFTLPVAGKP